LQDQGETMKNSKIEWTDHTFNPWMGCTKVSPACDNCYAAVSTPARTLGINWGAGQPRKRTIAANWKQPLLWDKQAKAEGVRRKVFCASLADVFDNEVDPQWRADLFELILQTQNLDWLLLTKRIGNANAMIFEALQQVNYSVVGFHDMSIPLNVWIGATICDQAEADRDIPKLLNVPAAKRFLSIEPLLGPIDLTQIFGVTTELNALTGVKTYTAIPDCKFKTFGDAIDWVIVGGETNGRPMHPDWALSLRDQCAEAGVAFFFKQWGDWHPKIWFEGGDICVGADAKVEADICGTTMVRVGKKAAGRLLDGVEHNEVPA
jgi:protein gp37